MTKEEIINKWEAKIVHCEKKEQRMINSGEYVKAHDFHERAYTILQCLVDLKKINEVDESEVKDCGTCRHVDWHKGKQPCIDCDGSHSKWQSSRAIIKP